MHLTAQSSFTFEDGQFRSEIDRFQSTEASWRAMARSQRVAKVTKVA